MDIRPQGHVGQLINAWIYLAIGFVCMGCKSQGMQLPARLVADDAIHHEVRTKSRGLSQRIVTTAGPYELHAKVKRSEDTTETSRGEKTVELKEIDAALFEGGREIVQIVCEERYEYTNKKGEIFSSGVVDQFKCEGSAAVGSFEVLIHPGADGGYEGQVSGATEGYLRSLHERFGGMLGPLRGYALGLPGQERAGVRKVYTTKPGEIWLTPEATALDVSVLLTAILFDDMK